MTLHRWCRCYNTYKSISIRYIYGNFNIWIFEDMISRPNRWELNIFLSIIVFWYRCTYSSIGKMERVGIIFNHIIRICSGETANICSSCLISNNITIIKVVIVKLYRIKDCGNARCLYTKFSVLISRTRWNNIDRS